MRRFPSNFVFLLIFALTCLPAVAQQDVISTLIGGGPNDIPALQADLNTPIEVAVDNAGNYYIAACSSTQNRVFKVNTSGILTVVAGAGPAGFSGDGVPGGAANAFLNCPAGIAVDSSGNVYISDYYNYVVRKVDTSSTITTIAGIGGTRGYSGDNGPATSAELNYPYGIALDTSGNLYIADSYNCVVRKVILSTGIISTYAGTGSSCSYGGDNGPATSAHLNYPGGVATDGSGNLYIADTNDFRIRYVAKSTLIISTIAGSGTYGFAGDGGPAIVAEISYVYEGVAVNAAGTTVTIADYSNQRIRQFAVAGNPNTGTINTVAGTGTVGFCGDSGAASSACFYDPEGVAVTASGGVYVADRYNDRIRFFTVSGIPNTGIINTVVGNGSTTFPTLTSGVPPQGVVLNYPWAVYEDPSANVFVSDTTNCLVRELVQATDLVNFFAGTGTCGDLGDGGPATAAELNKTYGLARDSSGNIYISDAVNQIIRMVTPSGTISTFAGTPGRCGFTGDGGLATSAELCYPYGVTVDSQNNVYIADYSNNRIRKVSGGTITTFAGNGVAGYLGDGDPATDAEIRLPEGVSTDAAGNVYIADYGNCRIREVSAATGIISTVAGDGFCGFTGDGPAIQNELNSPNGVRSDANGNLFIADTNNQRIRWVDLSGKMTTIAGTGTAGYTGDGGVATSAELYYPSGVALDASGNILVADQYNFRVRKISAFAALNTNADSLAFGIVTVGSTGTAQVLTVSAVGPLTISNITASGDFTEADDCGSSLANGKTCAIYVYFKPRAAGTRTGSLMIEDNGYFDDFTIVGLTGTGSALSVTGGPLVFANQLAKTTSAPQTVTATNQGTTAITMGAITVNDTTDFAISANTCPAAGHTLAARASCTISVTFTPATTGAKKGALIITDSDPSSPQFVGLTGTGTSNVVLSPASLAFAAQPVGVTTPTSSAKKITLTNSTGTSLTLGNPAVSITGPFSKISATSCTNSLVIAASGTCVIYVVFTPTAVGFPTGTLSVADSDPTSPQTVALSGIGTGVEFTPSSVNFGTSTVGHQVSSTVTITNVGTTPITFSAAAITGTNSKDFLTSATDPPCNTFLAPGAVCTFTMYFTPSLVGAESATYLVFDNSAGSPQSLPLTGTGQ